MERPSDRELAGHRRLLRDIAELQNEPYPNIKLHVHDSLRQLCLVLSPQDSNPIHLTATFNNYPFTAPQVTIQSAITHPNVFGNYVCASVLNTTDGYTPAYTFKSIAIQLLSFFCSENLEQDDSDAPINLSEYRQRGSRRYGYDQRGCYHCVLCGFDETGRDNPDPVTDVSAERILVNLPGSRRYSQPASNEPTKTTGHEETPSNHAPTPQMQPTPRGVDFLMPDNGNEVEKPEIVVTSKILGQPRRPILLDFPDEILLMIFSELSTMDLLAITRAFPRVQELLNSYDFIRIRELQCFCLKQSFLDAKLGVGVHIGGRNRVGTFSSEFDLLSQQAFETYGVRRSIQGLPFQHWLPLPIARRHWRTVREDIDQRLQTLGKAAKISGASALSVLSHFMNDVVVNFNQVAEETFTRNPRSTLTHASEKAVESYFALFHLLICMAAERPGMIRDANRKIAQFLDGNTSKTACPNLGHLLVAVLISDQGLTEELTMAVIKETILRNVVWMLDPKGAGMAELSYLEPSPVSEYRLEKTFQASRTSYRLLMFLSLFSRRARVPGKTLETIRDDMFDTHGAPPHGLASQMAAEIRRVKEINQFTPFLQDMGLKTIPEKAEFSDFLKRMIIKSAEVGYSCEPITQEEALAFRLVKELGVEVTEGLVPSEKPPRAYALCFFPGKGKGGSKGQKQEKGLEPSLRAGW
ncbi:MAG: hypothetical protein Q9219_003470 [cf. Caloplaca sp. 3 TL-2023]